MVSRDNTVSKKYIILKSLPWIYLAAFCIPVLRVHDLTFVLFGFGFFGIHSICGYFMLKDELKYSEENKQKITEEAISKEIRIVIAGLLAFAIIYTIKSI